MRRALLPWLVVAAGIVALGALWAPLLPEAEPSKPTRVATAVPAPHGDLEVDLGTRDLFGSEGQASELLALIGRQHYVPVTYRIRYRTEVDTVRLSANLRDGVLLREHHELGGRGSREVWSGYVLERLENAARGGSLNDTPVGKSVGMFTRY
jgi:hypothetical protein